VFEEEEEEEEEEFDVSSMEDLKKLPEYLYENLLPPESPSDEFYEFIED